MAQSVVATRPFEWVEPAYVFGIWGERASAYLPQNILTQIHKTFQLTLRHSEMVLCTSDQLLRILSRILADSLTTIIIRVSEAPDCHHEHTVTVD